MGKSEEEPWNGEPSRRAGSGAPSGRCRWSSREAPSGRCRPWRSAVATLRFPANKVKLVFRYTQFLKGFVEKSSFQNSLSAWVELAAGDSPDRKII